MTGLELWVVLTLGLVSSLHCVQMCGPIVLSYSVAPGPAHSTSWGSSRSLFFGHIANNLGPTSRQGLAEFRREALSPGASVEQYSEHPLGKALVALANAEGARLQAASSVEVLKGQGITGSVDSKHIVIGNRKLLEDQGVSLGNLCTGS